MALVTVQPTRGDVAVANAIAAHTGPVPEQAAQALSWGADEHLLLGLAVAGWAYACLRRPAWRPAADHLILAAVTAAALPHLMKRTIDQTRPDRLTVRGHWRGVPLSGNRRDAFPSGHALHMGALAGAATAFPPRLRAATWGLALTFSLSRVLLLAHWSSDVAAGFAMGVVLERALRRLTGYPASLRRHPAQGPAP